MIGGAGADLLNGGKGIDTADYATAGKGVAANLSGPKNQNTGDAAGDVFRGVENLSGSRFGDTLSGNKGGNVISGEKGGDILGGGGGNDRLFGGSGNDVLRGQRGNDRLDGGPGNDVMNGGGGADKFVFNGGDDRVVDFRDDVDTLLIDDSLWAGNLTVRELVRDYAEVKGDDILFTFDGGHSLRIISEDVKSHLLDDIQII